jgi:hypothetical protein
METFLFVHGAFQGGWVWCKVADFLRTRGHDVHTPTLSGCGYLTGTGYREIPERIRHAVFVDAVIPEEQRSFHTPFPTAFDPRRVPTSFISC